jgi:hypothetical protein
LLICSRWTKSLDQALYAEGLEVVATERKYFSDTYLAFQADVAMLSFNEMRHSMKSEDSDRYKTVLEAAERERMSAQKGVANQVQRCVFVAKLRS